MLPDARASFVRCALKRLPRVPAPDPVRPRFIQASEDVKPGQETVNISIKEGVRGPTAISRARCRGRGCRVNARSQPPRHSLFSHRRITARSCLRSSAALSLVRRSARARARALADSRGPPHPIYTPTHHHARARRSEKIFAAFAAKKGAQIDAYKFMKDGEQVKKDDTPDGIGLEDGDQLDAILNQQGGA